MSLLMFLLSLLLDGSQGQMEKYFLQVQRIVKAQEGLCIFVPCSFISPENRWFNLYPEYGYWFKEIRRQSLQYPVATNNKDKGLEQGAPGRFQLLGDLSQKKCSLLIKDVRWEDSTKYFFRIEKGYEKYSFKEAFTLQVEALTQKPDIFIPEILEPGQPVTIVCLFSWNFEQCPAPSFSWMGAAASFQETRPHTSHYSVLSFTPGLQHNGTELTCQLDFSRKSTQRTVQLRVAYAPRSLAISIFRDNVSVPELNRNPSHLEVQQGQSLRLLCTADSQPPATLSWVLEDRVLSWSSPVGSRTLALEMPWVKAGDSGHYTCQAQNRLGSQQQTLDLSVLYPPEDLRVTVSQENRTVLEILRNGTSLPVLEGQSLCLVCVTYSNPPASVSWFGATQTLIPTQSSEPGVLELPLVQREHEGELTCAAQSPLGTQRISLSLSVHYPPQMSRPSCSWDSEGLHCSCSSRAWPAPSLGWRLGEGLLEGNSSNASFTVMSSSAGPWVNSSLSLSVEFSTDHRLSCEAWNDYGVQRATIVLVPGQGVSQADKSETSGGAVQGAIWGAGLMALLAVSFCLIFFIVKFLRKKSALEVAAMEGNHLAKNLVSTINSASMISSNIPLRYPIQDHLNESESQTQKEEPPLATAPDIPKDEPELHYASLSFQGPRPQQPKNTETIKSVYTEIKIHKR